MPLINNKKNAIFKSCFLCFHFFGGVNEDVQQLRQLGINKCVMYFASEFFLIEWKIKS